MADSEISTTLPFVTRRTALLGTAMAFGTWGSGALATSDTAADPSPDPAVTLWRQWRDAHALTEQLCRRQQGLERQLIDAVGVPCVAVEWSDGERVTLHCLEAISDLFGLGPADAAARTRAEAELAAHQKRWDLADEAVGYSASLQAEREAADRAEGLLEALATTSATSLAGVAAKLDALVQEGKVWQDRAEFPWPQIRSALDDLLRLAPRLRRDGACASQMRMAPMEA